MVSWAGGHPRRSGGLCPIDVTPAHGFSQLGQNILRMPIRRWRGNPDPRVTLHDILGKAPALNIKDAQRVLSLRMILFRGAGKPLGGVFLVQGDFLAFHQIHRQLVLGIGVALLRGAPIPECGLGVILSHAPPVGVTIGQGCLRTRVAARGVPLYSFELRCIAGRDYLLAGRTGLSGWYEFDA
jgi:hypothetical protein